MAKILKTVLLVVVAVAVIYFAPQIAAFAGHAIFGAAVSAATISAITSAVVGIGISVALSAAGSLFRKAPSMSAANLSRLQQTVDPTAFRKIVFGRTAAAQDIRFFETYGAKSDQYATVIALASHPVNHIAGWYLENDQVWSPGGGIASNKYGLVGWRGYGYVGETPTGHPCGTQTLWTTTSKFSGCSYIICDFQLGQQSIPSKTTAIVEGCPVYDPRLDGTRGGSGPHRIDDQSTWTWRNPGTGVEIGRNPALCLLTYIIGWRYNGALMWGMGIDVIQINLDNFKTYANLCEEGVLTQDGSTVQRYTCDGIYQTSDTHESVIDSITAGMGSCKLSDVAGLYRLVGGYDETLGPVMEFTDRDIVGGVGSPAPWHWQPSVPLSDTYNIVRGRFADPGQLYQLSDWGEVRTETLADGIDRTLTLDLGTVSRAETCQRIAKQWLLREALTPGTFSATFGARGFAVEVGSVLSLTIQKMGWQAKLFRVESQKEVHDMLYEMTLREESSGVYAWDKEEKPLPARIIPAGYDPNMTITLQNVTLEAVTYQAA